MDKYISETYKTYFNTLSKVGYINSNKVNILLVLTFMYRLFSKDYRGFISTEDYKIINKAFSCLTGKDCLNRYRDIIKMGKLHIGEFTELSHRLCRLENDSINYCNCKEQIEELKEWLINNFMGNTCNCNAQFAELREYLEGKFANIDNKLNALTNSVASNSMLINNLGALLLKMYSNTENISVATLLENIIKCMTGQIPYDSKYDIDNNGIVDSADYYIVVNWIRESVLNTVIEQVNQGSVEPFDPNNLDPGPIPHTEGTLDGPN